MFAAPRGCRFRAGAPVGRWMSITTLTIAAQKHHSETNPLTVIHINTGTATKFMSPSSARSR